jgi:large subunit ribosomal protein L35Ae
LQFEYDGLILNYRLGKKTQSSKECLIKVFGIPLEETGHLVGWKVAWPESGPKIFGKIVGIHGRKGSLRARFSKGVPGQALGSRVKLYKSASEA